MNFVPRAVAKRKLAPGQSARVKKQSPYRRVSATETSTAAVSSSPSVLSRENAAEVQTSDAKRGRDDENKAKILDSSNEGSRRGESFPKEEKSSDQMTQIALPTCILSEEAVPSIAGAEKSLGVVSEARCSSDENVNGNNTAVSTYPEALSMSSLESRLPAPRVCLVEKPSEGDAKDLITPEEAFSKSPTRTRESLEDRLHRLERLTDGISNRLSALDGQIVGGNSDCKKASIADARNDIKVPQTACERKTARNCEIVHHEISDGGESSTRRNDVMGMKGNRESECKHTRSSHVGVISPKPIRNDQRDSAFADQENSDDDDDEEDGDGSDDVPPIVSFSKNQRWPEEDEPVCTVCGKYGEYICDQTEADVCSLECKAKNLVRRGLSVPEPKIGEQEETAASAEQEETFDPEEGTKAPFVYREHRAITSLTSEQVQDIRNEVQLFVEGINVHRPVLEFKQLGLPNKLQCNLEACGYLTPTPVQMQATPVGLALRDLMVCAQTSSGKTASFLIPAIASIYNQVLTAERDARHPNVMALAPTRELAMQIEDQAKQLMKGMSSMKTGLLVGGLPLPPQLHRLKQGVQFVVGTPGRILEIIRQEALTLDEIKLVVLDEVDSMLQLGFQQQVYDIMVHLPDSHQTILTSATIPSAIEKMATSLLNNPVFISVGTPSTPCTSVKQVILWVEDPAKKKKLFAILQDPKHFRPPVIVFVDSKPGADLLAQAVAKTCDLSAASLHGDKPQTERNEILQRFKEGAFQVLVSTGVLGRGINLPGVRLVINFDMPTSVEDYIHHIGRTGRLGATGTAMTFINNNSKKLFLQFTSLLKPLGVTLPQELVNSTHLSYQRQQHRSSQARAGSTGSRRGARASGERRGSSHRSSSGSRGFHRGHKRNKDRENVSDILKKRKWKFKH